jgi:hypothetical protein
MASTEITVTVRLANDAGITPEMVEAVDEFLDDAAGAFWHSPDTLALAQEAIRRLRIVVLGPEAD